MDWLPAFTTTSLLAAALWLGRGLVATRLARTVGHEFDTKLETLRAELRESEERLRADLRAKEAEITALRTGAMTAMASRQMAVDKRRLEAVDQLWSAVTALAQAKGLSATMAVFKFESAAERAQRDPKLRQFFEAIGGGFDMKALDLSGAAKARPFVSPIAWATYSALLAMTLHAVMRWYVLKSGLKAQDLMGDEPVTALIKAALPQYGNYIDKFGPAGFYLLSDQLESKLLQDLQAMLSGIEADKASIEQAAEILKRSNDVLKQLGRSRTKDSPSE
jgi:hypothetical protein